MKCRHTTILCILVAVLLLPLSGCNLPSNSESRLQTSIAETVAAINLNPPQVQTPEEQDPPQDAVLPSATSTLSQTITLTPSLTNSPTITLTSTLEVPMVSVSENTNCRTGPDKAYDYVGALMKGEQAEVVGQFQGGEYWIIKNPDRSGECWLWAYYSTVTGPTAGLPFYDQPATPTPGFYWEGTWSVSTGIVGDPFNMVYSMTATVNGKEYNATLDYGDGTFEYFTGTISDDYLSVSGTFPAGAMQGSFSFYAVGSDQFNGNTTAMVAFSMCGSRNAAAFPVPCYQP